MAVMEILDRKEHQLLDTTTEPQFIRVCDMATVLTVSESTCRRLIARGGVEAIKVSRAVRVSLRSLTRYIERRDYIQVARERKSQLARLKRFLRRRVN